MIGLLASLWSHGVQASDCVNDRSLVVTAPRSGAHTFHDSIAVRGFICQNYPFVLVKNETTNRSFLTDTIPSCSTNGCVYSFTTFVRDLAVGTNEISAGIPSDDGPAAVRLEIVRTALAFLFPKN